MTYDMNLDAKDRDIRLFRELLQRMDDARP